MTDVERLLEAAGERWRTAQRTPPEIDLAAFSPEARGAGLRALIAVAAVISVVILVVAATIQLGRSPEAGTPAVGGPPPSPSVEPSLADTSPPAVVSPAPVAACEVTRPTPAFVPPSPNPASPPGYDGAAWFGTPALWTMLDRAGETWAHLPTGSDGLSQKTFWWSTDWVPQAEPEPAITVLGTRLDGPGTFTAGPGTNASADFGTAMLVGVAVPAPGCWRLTATYLDASLSIVVLVKGD
jgi:hypothetical protein